MFPNISLALALCLTILAITAEGQQNRPGQDKCPQVNVMQNFDVNQFMGVWYEIQAQPNEWQKIKSCLASQYIRQGDIINIQSKGLNSQGRPTTNQSKMKITNNPARMITDFVPGLSPPYEVLDTDYRTYACVHSCLTVGPVTNNFVFIYSRRRRLSQEKINYCKNLFARYQGTKVSQLRPSQSGRCA